MSGKGWTIFGVLCVAFLGFLIWSSGKEKIDVSSVDYNKIQGADADNGQIADHVFGKADSKVVLIEYGDYQCPGCAEIYPTVKQLKENYKDKIAFVFRNFPLPTLHPNARAAAATAEAAGLQGKYWDMHDKIYTTQNAWQNLSGTDRVRFFEGYARDLGLDVKQFTADTSSESVSAKIKYDTELGKKRGVTGTPAFYLNGTELKSDVWGKYDSLKKAVEDALKK